VDHFAWVVLAFFAVIILRQWYRPDDLQEESPPTLWSLSKELWRDHRGVVLVGLGAAACVGWALDPTLEWARYYFSSFFQGFAALLGIAVTGMLVSHQLNVQQYGRLRPEEEELGICLGLHASVMFLAALGLGVGSSWFAGVLRLIASLVFFLATVAAMLTWRLVQGSIQSLRPRQAMQALVEDYLREHETLSSVIEHFDRLYQAGRKPFMDGWDGYLAALEDLEARALEVQGRIPNFQSLKLQAIARRLFQNEKYPRLKLAAKYMSIINERLDYGSEVCWPLALAFEGSPELLDKLVPFPGYPSLVDYARAHGGSPERQQISPEVALRVAFWWKLGQYGAIQAALRDLGITTLSQEDVPDPWADTEDFLRVFLDPSEKTSFRVLCSATIAQVFSSLRNPSASSMRDFARAAAQM